MGIDVTWVPYGRPAALALGARIAATKGDEPLNPVTVIVPTNHVGVATRRLLASGGAGPVCGRGVGVAAVTFVTPYRLADLLGAPGLAAAGRRPVSTPVIAAALRAALADEPGVFAPVAAHPATETALVHAYRELRDASPAALDALSGRSPRAGDVVRLHRAARSRLRPAWYDEQDLLQSAADLLRHRDAMAGDIGTVVVYLPQQLSRHSADLLRAVADVTNVSVLAGTTGDRRADAEVARSVRRLGVAAEPEVDPPPIVGSGRTRILTASDSDEEVRAAVRAVLDAARAGTPLDRIALLHASPEPYGRLAHEQLGAAGIPCNGASAVALPGRAAGRTLLGLLALPRQSFRRVDVFGWLAGARLHHQGHAAPVTSWERVSREAGVVADRRQWDSLLATYADDREASADRADANPDGPPRHGERARHEAARARQLRQFMLGLIDSLDEAGRHPRPWSDHARWASGLLSSLLGPSRHGWPTAERAAAERVERALDRLACLDNLEGPIGLDVFARTLQLELEADLGRVGRLGQGVLVGSVAMGVGLDLDLVVVLGLAEGSFPAPVRDDSLLPDHERQAAGDDLALRNQRVDREHRQLLAALAGAADQLLCVPRGDLRRSSERVPSRWVLEIAGTLAGDRRWSNDLLSDRAGPPWLIHVASFDDGLRRVVFPATAQEHRLRSLMAGSPVTEAGADVVRQRRSPSFTRFDGNLAGLAIPSPVQHVTSATTMERWTACPFAYLLHHVLGVREVINPEDQLQISALDAGSLVHEALEQFVVEMLAGEVPQPDQPWPSAHRARLQVIGRAVCDKYEAHGLTGRPIFWHRDRNRILADLNRFLAEDDRHRASHRTRPVAAELAFGMGGDLGPVDIDLPDGRALRFRGKADRVDIAEDGTLHVVDYKTGGADRYKDLTEAAPDQRGRRLQLLVYGQATRLWWRTPRAPVQAEYWFVSAKGRFVRIGYPVTDTVLAHVSATLGTMVRGIEEGVFPNYPTASTTSPFVECPFCDPDGLGVGELRTAWERKAADPAMAPFVELTVGMNDG